VTVHVADTAPYPWPYDGRLDGDALALVLVGWDERWSGRSSDDAGASLRCHQLAAAVVAHGGEVLVVAHDGAPPLGLDVAARTVAAPALDAWYASPIDAWLRAAGRTHLLVAGHGLEGPVHSTLRSANDRGYECLLVTDACTSLQDDLAAAAALTVTMSGGIFGAIGTTDPVLIALSASDPDLQEP
jgi:hypothetical protein